jgi:hypothetical protein
VSDRDTSGDGFTGGVSGSQEEAAWRDLIARYETPADLSGGPAPWPDREDLHDQPAPLDAEADADDPADAGPAPNEDGPGSTGAADDTEGLKNQGKSSSQAPGFGRTRIIRPATPRPESPSPPDSPASGQVPPASDDAGPWACEGSTRGSFGGAGLGTGSDPEDADDADEHYIPPPPPPLPHLDPVAKGAWAALFGGPAYLFVSTLIGRNAPGWAALLAVAAFIGGFAVVVLRHGGGPSRGDGPDNGAVL